METTSSHHDKEGIASSNDMLVAKMPTASPSKSFSRADDNKIIIDVGGVVFSLSRTAILDSRHSDSSLSRAVLNGTHFNPTTRQYSFDRNPEVFGYVADYIRTGELHAPHGMCGEMVWRELEYWGIPREAMSPCCSHKLGKYSRKLEEKEAIEKEFSRRCVDDVWPVDGEETRGSCCSNRTKRKLWMFLNEPRSSKGALVFSLVLFLLIILSIIVMMINTSLSFRQPYTTNETVMAKLQNSISAMNITNEKISMRITTTGPTITAVLGYICVAFFTIEFILRLIAERNRCAFLRSTYAILDLLALIPSFVDTIIKGIFFGRALYENYTFITLFWVSELFLVLRILRLFRLAEYYDGLRVLLLSLKASWRELVLLEAFLLIGMSIFGSLVYYAEIMEGDGDFGEILIGCWWAVITMTTVGYGDTHPKFPGGYVVGYVAATFGVILMGLPIAIIANNFSKYYQFLAEKAEKKKTDKAQAIHNGKIQVKEFQTKKDGSFKHSQVNPQDF
ncbi:potassium voltage-gated channel protein Shaw [Lingula anatina]|uniref:Potassium voltage-gated channel protein Shaw n=1 Tax=Lingula anatina TaxID=7574 RepID=A0A1S3HPW0_LINAN|nr:potassium voltage-gated channel protein Shaw [Lingula anatina]|eukprot:XP_013387074.1 potassium voltage-gated channel protein Shaw [Lingula anatina]